MPTQPERQTPTRPKLALTLALALASGLGGAAAAATADKPPAGARSIAGKWALNEPGIVPFGYNGATKGVDDHPPLTPEYEKAYRERVAAAEAGRPSRDNGAACLPNGMPRMMRDRGIYPIEIVVTPNVVYTLHEYQRQIRRIYTDGRKHPPADDLDSSFSGHSVGHWEGDTLVVDTVGIKAGWYDQRGIAHSDKVHVAERIRRVDANTLENKITITDPPAFTGSWTVIKRYNVETAHEMSEFVCEENNRNPIGADGSVQAVVSTTGTN